LIFIKRLPRLRAHDKVVAVGQAEGKNAAG